MFPGAKLHDYQRKILEVDWSKLENRVLCYGGSIIGPRISVYFGKYHKGDLMDTIVDLEQANIHVRAKYLDESALSEVNKVRAKKGFPLLGPRKPLKPGEPNRYQMRAEIGQTPTSGPLARQNDADKKGYMHPTKGYRKRNMKHVLCAQITAEKKRGTKWPLARMKSVITSPDNFS